MPEKKTRERARKAKREGKAATTQAGEYVREEMEHAKEHKHPVKNRRQAIAIGLSTARRDGVKVPAKGQSAGKKTAAKKTTARKTGAKKTTAKKTTAKKTTAKKTAKTSTAKSHSHRKSAGSAKRRAASRSGASRKTAHRRK